ncbi:MAG: hypothetical protein K0U24_04965 [Gammaproteobacteria bacterium]|nr:hypothetical protein [Gammaproteobacteria bacterium]MCH9715664.1 hypothetical protein [Gammaproteobacteria bacterium]MCH9763568.1 hypothetical protein [Gammaproteobacteria bacterium]
MPASEYTFFEAITSSAVQKRKESSDIATQLITTPHDKFQQRIKLTEGLIRQMPDDRPAITNALKDELEKMLTEEENAKPKPGIQP